MLNSIKTEDQRTTVEIGMDCIMPGIEIANGVLYGAWEEFFGNVPQRNISATEAEHLGRILYAACDMVSNAIREYHLMLGHYELDLVKYFMENAEHIAKTIEARKAIETMRKEKRFDDVEKAMTLDNEAVIKLLASKEADNG